MTGIKQFRFPKLSHRVYICGRTGGGKTVGAAWVLSESAIDKQPFIVFDYKGDELLTSIKYFRELRVGEMPSKRDNGVYIVHPTHKDDEAVNEWLWKIHAAGGIGLYFDEAYMVPGGQRAQKGPLQAILTQGRSLKIPVIALTQRPLFVNRFLTSEADHFQVFKLTSLVDRKAIEQSLPRGSLDIELRQYHSLWFDVGEDALFRLKPAPNPELIQQRLEDRLKPERCYY